DPGGGLPRQLTRLEANACAGTHRRQVIEPIEAIAGYGGALEKTAARAGRSLGPANPEQPPPAEVGNLRQGQGVEVMRVGVAGLKILTPAGEVDCLFALRQIIRGEPSSLVLR